MGVWIETLLAYHNQSIPARCLVVARLEDCAGAAGDRSRWLRDSLHGLQHPDAC